MYLTMFLERICLVVIEVKFSAAFPSALYSLVSSSFSAFTDFVIDLDKEYSCERHNFILFSRNDRLVNELTFGKELKMVSRAKFPNLTYIDNILHPEI